MKFQLLTRAAAAALAAGGDVAADPDAGPEPGKGGADGQDGSEQKPADQPKTTDTSSDGGSQAGDTPVNVVAAADVASLTATAEKKGFAAANARMKAVFDSPEGKANAHTAAFLLATSEASADEIIGHLKGQAPAAPAASSDAKPGIPDTKTDIKTDPAAIAAANASGDVDKSWDDVFAEQAQANAPIVPAAHVAAAAGAPTITARALPRTGN